MAYRSNLRELPDLVKYLLEEREAAQVELRYTFDEPHIPADFKRSEFLEPADWMWLQNELRDYSAQQVLLNLPPGLPPPGSDGAWTLPAARPQTDAAAPADAAGAEPADPPTAEPGDGEGAAPDIETLLGAPLDFEFPQLPPANIEKVIRGCYAFTLSSSGKLVVSRALSDHLAYDIKDGMLMQTHVRNITDAADFIRRLPF
jgi:hypothetical protein